MNLIFVGFLPPDSHNAEERTFVRALARLFSRTVVFQGIGVKGMDLEHLGKVPLRLAKIHLPRPSAGIDVGVLPVFPLRRGPATRLSSWLIRHRLAAVTGGQFDDWVFWSRFPSPELVAAIQGLPFGRIVYEPMDRYAAGSYFSTEERRRIETAEAALTQRATVITTTVGLAKRFERAAGGSYAMPLGKDATLTARKSGIADHIRRPRLVVAGSLDWLADETLLVEVARQRPQWQLVLAGPRDRSWGRRLARFGNVHWVGAVAPDVARGLIADCDVALNPCVRNAWTEVAVQVKLFDYLAEGRPVVSTPLPELRIFEDLIELASPDEWIGSIERALQTDGPALGEQRRAASDRFTLQDRARRAYELVAEAPVEVMSGRLA